MTLEEIENYMNGQGDLMEVVCANCGQRYGNHSGYNCPIGKNNHSYTEEPLFVPEKLSVKVLDPNAQFRFRKDYPSE